MVQLKNVGDLLSITEGSSALDEVANTLLGATDSLWDLVDILGLDHCLEVIFQQLGEVVFYQMISTIELYFWCPISTYSAVQNLGNT
jgi:hypothetical protein